MDIYEAIALGIIQGLTEFIPVSSSGHLLLLHHALGITEHGLAFDVALHIGTLTALLLLFHRDLVELAKALFKTGPKTPLALILVMATVPAVIAGLLLEPLAATTFRSPWLVVVMMAAFGLLMLAAERYTAQRQNKTSLEKVNVSQGLIVGMAQAAALVPGVSRSGSTIIAGLFAGLDRVAATRFSFLLAVPITLGAIIRVALDKDTLRQVSADPGIFITGILTAFIFGVIAIRFLLKFVAKHNLNIFAYYRLVLATIVLMLLLAA